MSPSAERWSGSQTVYPPRSRRRPPISAPSGRGGRWRARQGGRSCPSAPEGSGRRAPQPMPLSSSSPSCPVRRLRLDPLGGPNRADEVLLGVRVVQTRGDGERGGHAASRMRPVKLNLERADPPGVTKLFGNTD